MRKRAYAPRRETRLCRMTKWNPENFLKKNTKIKYFQSENGNRNESLPRIERSLGIEAQAGNSSAKLHRATRRPMGFTKRRKKVAAWPSRPFQRTYTDTLTHLRRRFQRPKSTRESERKENFFRIECVRIRPLCLNRHKRWIVLKKRSTDSQPLS